MEAELIDQAIDQVAHKIIVGDLSVEDVRNQNEHYGFTIYNGDDEIEGVTLDHVQLEQAIYFAQSAMVRERHIQEIESVYAVPMEYFR